MDNDVENKSCSFCGTSGRKGMRLAGGFGAMMCEPCVEHYHQVFQDPGKSQASARAPWFTMDEREILATIPMIAHTADQVAGFLVEWVQLARDRNLSWAAIGDALGVSRQASWERFSSRMHGA